MSEVEAHWDELFAGRAPSRPHPFLPGTLGDVAPGRALELGSGDGNTAVWLAEHGWTVTAVDVSTVALGLVADRAARAGVAARVTTVHADLEGWTTREAFDLVAALFLHTRFAFDREGVLRRAAGRVAPGGRLLVVGHLTSPSWAKADRHRPEFLDAAGTVAALGLGDGGWAFEHVEDRPRTMTRDGRTAEVLDAVVLARRVSG